jgi:hypothetical protein
MDNGCSDIRTVAIPCKEFVNPFKAIEMDFDHTVYLICNNGDKINLGKGMIQENKIVLLDSVIDNITFTTTNA